MKKKLGFSMFKYLIFLLASHSLFAITTYHVILSSDNDPGGFGETNDFRFFLNTMNVSLNTTTEDTYEIVFDSPMTIQINGSLPIINNSSNYAKITIGNSGPIPNVIIDGINGTTNGNIYPYSGFFIANGNVTIQNIIFQNLTAKGGDGGNGISGGGGGFGAGGAIYVPQQFLNGFQPLTTLINVSINNCAAIGGDGGSYLGSSATGAEGGGGGGGFGGNGGSITTTGSTGGAGGGGFGGDGGDVTLLVDSNGGGGGGGLGSRATSGPNLGNGGSDVDAGQDGNGFGIEILAGSGAGGNSGGNFLGGGGGGSSTGGSSGGGGGGSLGSAGTSPQGLSPPGGTPLASGGNGGDGGGGGGGGVIGGPPSNNLDGAAGSGGYGGGGGGGAGYGYFDTAYTVEGGSGGLELYQIGGGGGGGGADVAGHTFAGGGNSFGGGGGGGGGPSNSGSSAPGGTDTGNLGGGAGGAGANGAGFGFGGGGGGGGSGLGAAIFVDSGLVFTIQAISGIPTTFNTPTNMVQAGTHGSGGDGGLDGTDGLALGNSIFLRSNSLLQFIAQDAGDLLTLGEQVSFVDDTSFGAGGTSVNVRGNGTVVYYGTTDYQGTLSIYNANFKVYGEINSANIMVCRAGLNAKRGTLSGTGRLTGAVTANSGVISPDAGGTLTLGSLSLAAVDSIQGFLGSLVHIEIDSSSTPSVVVVDGPASLAGFLEIDLDPNVMPGAYTILTSTGITGTFDAVIFTGATPNYKLSYLPIGSPTYVQFEFLGYPIPPPPPPSNTVEPPSQLRGKQKKNDFGFEYELYNQLTWKSSSSPDVIGYFIYRDGKKIATVNASTHTYQDHNRKKGVFYAYAIRAFNSAGIESSPVNIVVKP